MADKLSSKEAGDFIVSSGQASAFAKQLELGDARPFHIDWFQGTSHRCSVEDVVKHFGGEWIRTKAVPHYDECYTNGVIHVRRSSTRRDMGLFIVVPGSANPDFHEAFLREKDFRPSRLDIAYDTSSYTVAEVWQAWLDGKVQLQAKRENVKMITGSHGSPETITFGGRRSSAYVRCYDKAAEQKLKGGQTWSRFEYEFKRHAAKYIWDNMDKTVACCLGTLRILERSYRNMADNRNKLASFFKEWLVADKVDYGIFDSGRCLSFNPPPKSPPSDHPPTKKPPRIAPQGLPQSTVVN